MPSQPVSVLIIGFSLFGLGCETHNVALAGGSAASTGSGGAAASPSGGTPTAGDPTCAQLGLPTRPFVASAVGGDFGDVAGDFTVQTLAGPWTLSEQWSGCDSYVFISLSSSRQVPFGDQLWASNPRDLLETGAANAHYFFGSYDADPTPKLHEMRANVEAALAAMGPDAQAWWEPRVHYVAGALTDIEGSVGGLYAGHHPGVLFGIAIDRAQRFDSGGYLGRFQAGGFAGDLKMAGYLSRYYNFAAEQDMALAAEAAVTVVPLMTNEFVTQNDQLYQADFPSGDVMADFDSMVIDVQATCGPEPTDCGEWDYEAFLHFCHDSACSDASEIGLWMTPYARPGTRRWLIDATPFLPLVRDGGSHGFRFGMLWNMNPNTMNVAFRLKDAGLGEKPVSITPLFSGGKFDTAYNTKYEPLTVTPPSTAKRVELVALISGHGQDAPDHCAEWCNHEHMFTVDGTAHTKSHSGEAGAPFGCAERVDEGVVPGQYGNWAPSRAAWCPGLPVQPWRVDVTADVALGQPNEITYQGAFNGGEPEGGRIRMNSYLVTYE